MPRSRRTRPAGLLLAVAGALLTAACASAPPPAPAAPAPPPAPTGPDAFRDFGGEVVQPGQRFEIGGTPMGVAGLEVVLTLAKADYRSETRPNGVVEGSGTAYFVVEKGQEMENLRVPQGESRTAFGARVTVEWARVDYIEERLKYLPRAAIVVEPAP